MPPDRFAISIVSHGHDRLLRTLLQELADAPPAALDEVVVTHNLPPEGAAVGSVPWPFRLRERVNERPLGFGANHNRALAGATASAFCVLNPDVSAIRPGVWEALRVAASGHGVGCAYPVLLNTDGTVQDSRREVPTPWALAKRRLLGWPDRRTDWVSAAFCMFPAEAYRRIGGFDERFFLYCEDVDLCLRLQLHGYSLVGVDDTAVHAAARQSDRHGRHLAWHVRSLARLWTGRVMWRFLAQRAAFGGRGSV